jgi:acetolactate synthase-1/2/3 large subunit
LTDLTGGQALVQQLALEGVTKVFGIPGVQLDWAVDPLIDVADRIALIVPRHEQATSYMADGYARTTGEVGVCMVVPGPGVLNAMSGLATAYACSSPVLCIAGQIASHGINRRYGMLHEINDQTKTLATVTKLSLIARRPQEIPRAVREAFIQLRSGRPRPVSLEVPPDILQARADISLVHPTALPSPHAPPEPDIERAAELLSRARFPVIWTGGGASASNASLAIERLATKLNAPVVMSDNGRGALSDHHALALPALAGRALLPHADVVLVVGSRFLNLRGQPVLSAPHSKFIYLNIDAHAAGEPRQPGLLLLGDARVGCEQLLLALKSNVGGGPGARVCSQVRTWCDQQLNLIEPQISWLKALRHAIPEDGILVNELTQVGYIAPQAYPVYGPRTFITPGYQGTLGYGFPTGLGAAAGNPGRVVVCITGDGGFGWNLQELATAAKYQLPLVVVVFSDGAFGNVRRIQQEVFSREIGTALHNPDFIKLADAFGVSAVRVDSPDALAAQIRAASQIQPRAPLLIEVPVGEMPSPWHLIHSVSKPPYPPPANPLGEPCED